MMIKRVLVSTAIMALGLLPVAGAGGAPGAATQSQSAPSTLSRQERVFGLVTFYATAKQYFAWFEHVPKLDWDQAFMEYLPLVERQQSTLDYYRVLMRFAALLEDGHTQVYLPQSLQQAQDSLPLRLELVDGQWVITERHPAEEILAKDIPPGSVLLAIQGQEPSSYFAENVFPYIAAGSLAARQSDVNWCMTFPKGSSVSLKVRYPDGSTETRSLSASRRSVKWDDATRNRYLLPWHRPPHFSYSFLEGNILHVRYGSCDKECLAGFSKLIVSPETAKASALILDLRGNTGGSDPIQTASELIANPISFYQCRTRWSSSYFEAQTNGLSQEVMASWLRSHQMPASMSPGWMSLSGTNPFPIKPAENHFDGPLVILTNIETGSAAEDLAVLLHACGRATVIGQRSAGSTGQPLFVDLPGGGRARICTVQVKYTDGREFVGPGIQPDVPIKRTIEGLTKDQDEVLRGALDFIRKKGTTTSQAGHVGS